MAAARRNGRYIDRATAVQLVTERFFPVTRRAIERWEIPGKLIGRKFHMSESAVMAYAQKLLDSAPAAPAPRPRHER